MQKFSRNHRIAAITKVLLENPNKIMGLNNFTEMFNTAKSTISEDIVVIKDTLSKLNMGRMDTVAGAAGGIKYICGISPEKTRKFAEKLCIILKNRERIIPGNFLYMTDIMFNPKIIHTAGVILASIFIEKGIDCVVTVETKGIPLAYEVARMLGVQLVVVRRETKFTEGSTLTINYVSGSTGRIQNMSLSKKALKKGSRCIFIDDFMKAGGTAMGIIDLLKEFESELLGIGFLIDNVGIPKKLVQNYVSIVDFKGIDENGNASLSPSQMFN
ncbi:pur operon repressor [Clostridium sp. Mt-5]|uniref:Pur operon repressor n=1 Tax=Clostridium moutaii TaxID=3240932 RepID=A0ABV4BPZ0_9CLOT